jgi:anthranilate synthase component 2
MAARILVLDNYDSFVFNLVQYLGQLGAECEVRRNDEIALADVGRAGAAGVLLSPGPGTPDRAGICLDVIREYAGVLPIFGVCLGHQAIGAALGARVVRAGVQMHGKTSVISTDRRGLYSGLPEQFTVNRYHSLVIERASLPAVLQVSASADDDGEIMGVRHAELAGTATPLEGVQFHPESIISEHGHALLKNFLQGSR